MAYDTDNIFAKILRDEIPCDKVYENDHALAFRDVNPQAPVHVLVVPKGQFVSSSDFFETAGEAEIAGFVRAVAEAARLEGVTAGGYRLIANAGDDGHQEVPHFHMHLLGGRPMGRMVQPARD